MNHTRDTSWGVPTYPHFLPLFAIVIQPAKKNAPSGACIAIKSATMESVPKMAVLYRYICINMDYLAGSKNAKVGSRIVPNTEVLLCRYKARNLSIARFCEAS